MPDFVILDGDQAVFFPAFGIAVVIAPSGKMTGTGKVSLLGKKLCLEGDESKLSVSGCVYITASHPIPGMGAVKINRLGGNQTSKKTKSGGKAIIVKGSQFSAVFEVQTPAQQPQATGPVPDATPQYAGNGMFVTLNTKFKVA